jgi:hypothetical protein
MEIASKKNAVRKGAGRAACIFWRLKKESSGVLSAARGIAVRTIKIQISAPTV